MTDDQSGCGATDAPGRLREDPMTISNPDDVVEAVARAICCGDVCGFEHGCSGPQFSLERAKRAISVLSALPPSTWRGRGLEQVERPGSPSGEPQEACPQAQHSDGGCENCALQAGVIKRLERRIDISRAAWLRAAEAALRDVPGASNSTHPAHDLWLRIEMAKLPPDEIVQSAADQTRSLDKPLSDGGRDHG